MSDFEYLGRMAIGQYLPIPSFLHARDPRAKLAGFTLLILSITLTGHLEGLGIAILAAALLLLTSRVPASYALKGVLPPLPFLVLLAILQVFLIEPEAGAEPIFSIWNLEIFESGFLAGIQLLLRFFLLIILFTVVSASISTIELIYGLDLLLSPLRMIGVHTEAAVITLQITFRFIPFLAINAERIAKSQASRGAEWGSGKMNLIKRVRQLIPLLVPLFNRSLEQAETLAEAMLARGFDSGGSRSGRAEFTFDGWDLLFVFGCLGAAVLILIPVFQY